MSLKPPLFVPCLGATVIVCVCVCVCVCLHVVVVVVVVCIVVSQSNSSIINNNNKPQTHQIKQTCQTHTLIHIGGCHQSRQDRYTHRISVVVVVVVHVVVVVVVVVVIHVVVVHRLNRSFFFQNTK